MTAEGAADSGAGGGGRGCEGGSGGRLRAPLHPPLPAPGGEGCAKCASFVGTLLAEAVGCERGCYVHPSSARPPGAPWCQARGGLSLLTGPRCARGERLLATLVHKELGARAHPDGLCPPPAPFPASFTPSALLARNLLGTCWSDSRDLLFDSHPHVAELGLRFLFRSCSFPLRVRAVEANGQLLESCSCLTL